MKKLLLTAGLVLAAAPAMAHPTGIPYSTRGECESAFAGFSKLDRERLSSLGFTPGEAQRTFNDLFDCRYDPAVDKWFIVLIGSF